MLVKDYFERSVSCMLSILEVKPVTFNITNVVISSTGESGDLKELNRSVIMLICWFEDQIDYFPGSYIVLPKTGKELNNKGTHFPKRRISIVWEHQQDGQSYFF